MKIIRFITGLFLIEILLCTNAVFAQVLKENPIILPDNMDTANCVLFPAAMEWNIRQPIISNVGNINLASTPMVGDIDNDGEQEIVIPSATSDVVSKIVILHADGTLKSQFNIAGSYVWNSVGIAKIRWQENLFKTIIVVFGTNKHLYAYDAYGTQLWQSNQPFNSHNGEIYMIPAISFADFNHDGWTEVFIGSEIFDAATGVLLCKTNGNQGSAYRTWAWTHTPYQTMAADLYGDSRLELAIGNTVYSVDIQSRTNFSANQISIASQLPTYAMTMEDGSSIPFTDGNTFLADINLDGSLDVLVMNVDGDSRIVYLYVWDVASSTIICSKKITNARKFGTPQIGDLDNNGYPEICFITGTYSDHGTGDNDKIYALKYNPSNSNNALDVFWSIPHEDSSGSTGLTMFDFNQDGYVELVYRDCNNLRIINGSLYNHQTGQPISQPYDLASISCHSTTGVEYPVISDVDLDGEAEIIVGGEAYLAAYGHIYILKSESVPWAPARPVWNQFMYNVTNVNKDLTIPQYQFNNATPFTDPDDVVRRPFNNFLQQATTLDQYGRPYIAAADASVLSTNISTDSGEVTLNVTYTNQGDYILKAPYTITVFANHENGDVLQTITVNTPLPVGETIWQNIVLPISDLCSFQGISTLDVAINCAGSGIAQNGGLQPECDITNNTAQVALNFQSEPTTITEFACEQFIWNGNTYSQSGQYQQTLQDSYGCDSIVIMNLTIETNSDPTYFSDTACDQYQWNGIYYSQSGQYQQLFQNSNGCDSIAILDLTIETASNYSIHGKSAIFPSTDITSGQYSYFVDSTGINPTNVHWDIDREDWLLIPHGASCDLVCMSEGQAVLHAWTEGELCDVDTTMVLNATFYSIGESNTQSASVYPNPTSGKVTIIWQDIVAIKVFNLLGQKVDEYKFEKQDKVELDLYNYQEAVYALEISTSDRKAYKSVVLTK